MLTRLVQLRIISFSNTISNIILCYYTLSQSWKVFTNKTAQLYLLCDHIHYVSL